MTFCLPRALKIAPTHTVLEMATMDNERGSRCLRYELETYVTSIHDDDTRFAVRRNGKLFHIHVSPTEFINSPATTNKYLLYLELLRSGAEVLGDVFDTDVYGWVTRPFEGLFAELAPRPVLPDGHANITVTLQEHLFPSFFLFALDVVDEKLQPRRIESKASPYSPPQVLLDDDFLDDLEKWTTLYDAARIVLSFDNPDDALFKPPGKVLIDDGRTACFFEPCFSGVQTKTELQAYQKIASANLDARSSVCRLFGVVLDKNDLVLGLLLTYIDHGGLLISEAATPTAGSKDRWRGLGRGIWQAWPRLESLSLKTKRRNAGRPDGFSALGYLVGVRP